MEEIDQSNIMYNKDEILKDKQQVINELWQNNNMSCIDKLTNTLFAFLYSVLYLFYVTIYYYFMPLMTIAFLFGFGHDKENDDDELLRDS